LFLVARSLSTGAARPIRNATLQLLLWLAFLCPLVAQGQESGCISLNSPSKHAAWDALKGIGCGNARISLQAFVEKYGSKACKPDGARRIVCSAAVRASDLQNTTIDGGGWQLIFSDPSPGKGGIVLTRASNIVIRDVDIAWRTEDFGQSPISPGERIYSRGKVVSCNADKGGAIDLQTATEATLDITAVSVWDDQSGWPWESRWSGKPIERYLSSAEAAMQFRGGQGPCLGFLKPLSGNRILVRHKVYSANAFHCFECERIVVDGLSVRDAPGMGVYFANGGRGFLLRNVSIKPACGNVCPRAYPSAAADGIHFAAVGGGIVIENSDIGWQGDDAVNITGLLMPGRVQGPKTEGGRVWVELEAKFKNRSWLFRVGGEVSIFDLGLRSYGTARVVEVDGEKLRVLLSRAPDNIADLVLTASDRVPRDVVIRNNRFHDHRARGILMGASNALIQGNTIERVTMAAIMVPADTDRWFEGPGATDVTISGNRISKVNANVYAPDYPSAISIAFRPSPQYKGLLGTPIRRIKVENNKIDEVFSNASTPVFFGRGTEAR
jgi:Right handed beta helix region